MYLDAFRSFKYITIELIFASICLSFHLSSFRVVSVFRVVVTGSAVRLQTIITEPLSSRGAAATTHRNAAYH